MHTSAKFLCQQYVACWLAIGSNARFVKNTHAGMHEFNLRMKGRGKTNLIREKRSTANAADAWKKKQKYGKKWCWRESFAAEVLYLSKQGVSLDLWVKRVKRVQRSYQGSTKLSPLLHLKNWILVLIQKGSNAKKESNWCAEPKRLYTNFSNENKERKRENQSFFIATILCFPDLTIDASKACSEVG